MNIILAGIIGRYPYGGVAWCSLMYLLGLRKLGHQVWYLEDTGECNFDPLRNTLSKDPRYATDFINSCLQPYGFGDRWCYVDWKGRYHGHSREAFRRVCEGADLFLDLSGGCWFWRDEYARIPHSAFIDSDPGFTQLAIAEGPAAPRYATFLPNFGTLFTFGRNIDTPASPVPTAPFTWEHTWQPISMDEWTPGEEPPRRVLTTIMSWKISSFAGLGGNKGVEMRKFLHMPARASIPLELAMAGPEEIVRAHGWLYRDAFSVSHSLDAYRDYIRSSLAEFSAAKHIYVAKNTGWFSDRTECYLASGHPAVVQDTGFSAHLPTGEGLFAYRTIDEALAAIDALLSDYERHSRAARELAQAHFAAEVVLPPLLERATRSTKNAEPALSEERRA